MKSWGCPWFPFVRELLREAAAKSPCPLTYEGGIQSLSPLAKGGYRGVPMARQHDTRRPAPGRRDGHDHWRGAWSDKASGTGHRDCLDHSPSLEPRSGGGSKPGGASPRSPRWEKPIPCLVPHGQGSVPRQRFGVNPPGLGRVGDKCFIAARGLRDQAPTCRPIRVLVARARSESSKGPRR